MSKSTNTFFALGLLLVGGFALSLGSKAQNISAKFKASPLVPNNFSLQGGISFNLPIQIVNQSSFDVTINNIYISIQNATGSTYQDLFYMTSPISSVLIRKQAATNINQVPLKADYSSAVTIWQIVNGSKSSNLKVVVRFEAVGIELAPIEFFVDAKQLLAPFKSVLGNFLSGLPAVNSLGYQANSVHYRKIKDGSKFNQYFPLASHLEGFAANGAEPDKTVSIMADMVKKYAYQTAKIAPLLKGKDLTDTCKNVYTFLHDYIQYKHDSDTAEQLRTPARAWADRTSGIDCDCFTNFAVSILYNLGITSQIKAVSIRPDKALQHVYAIVPNKADAKGYTVIDACVHKFNTEPYNLTNQLIKTVQA